jgi:hypothetical protein
MSATQAVKELIEHQLEAIELETANLRDALRQLEPNGTAAPTRGNGRRREKVPSETRAPRRNATVPRQQNSKLRPRRAAAVALNLQELLAEHDGLTTTAIAEQAGLRRDQTLALLKELEDRSEVRRSGQRRGVRWHAITDEDRIQARAAELAARRKR